jgi:hypothetical protein
VPLRDAILETGREFKIEETTGKVSSRLLALKVFLRAEFCVTSILEKANRAIYVDNLSPSKQPPIRYPTFLRHATSEYHSCKTESMQSKDVHSRRSSSGCLPDAKSTSCHHIASRWMCTSRHRRHVWAGDQTTYRPCYRTYHHCWLQKSWGGCKEQKASFFKADMMRWF